MRGSRWWPTVLRVLGTVALAAPGWLVLGYLATAPLGAIYGWSGHPAIPAAPMSVYVGVYLVVLPLVCVVAAWILIGRAVRRRLG